MVFFFYQHNTITTIFAHTCPKWLMDIRELQSKITVVLMAADYNKLFLHYAPQNIMTKSRVLTL